MKKLKFLSFAVAALLCAGFVSCGDDEGESNGTNEYGVAVSQEVDLGLSVNWAGWNVGANKPEGYGGYYAWGEIEEKEVYDWTTYKWCNGSEYKMTKYCTNSKFGMVDNKTELELEDDVAHVKWGNGWRMPTKAEFDELDSNCTWERITMYGVNGYKVTSKINGNSIFLPAAGFISYSSHKGMDYEGYCWTNTLHSGNNWYFGDAWKFGFDSGDEWELGFDDADDSHDYYYSRSVGCTVRPVKSK